MLLRLVQSFLADKRASMATQVVVFSVMLFGMSGVVLDFGRVYNEHSRMQAFTDQAALAAARQLDGRMGDPNDGENENAVVRAVGAVFTSTGQPVIEKAVAHGGGNDANLYRVSHLFFLRDLSEDDGPQYAIGNDLVGDNLLFMYTPGTSVDTNSAAVRRATAQARYVVAVGEERSVLNSLMGLVNAAEDSGIENSQTIRTVSVAQKRTIWTGEMSNLAVCNPWENNENESAIAALENPANVGVHFRHRADGLSTAAALSAQNSLALRANLRGSDAVSAICEDSQSLPGLDPQGSAQAAALARSICYLAASEQDEFVIPDEIAIRAAGPEEVTTALNTVFDMWDMPIAGVLEWDRDGNGVHSQAYDFEGNALFQAGTEHPLRAASALFQPGLNVMKGRVWDEPTANANRTNLGVPDSSRLNYPRTTATSDFELVINSCIRPNSGLGGLNCFQDSEGNIIDYMSTSTNIFGTLNFYTANFDAHYQSTFYTNPDTNRMTTFADTSNLLIEQWTHNSTFEHADFANFTVSYAVGDTYAVSGEDASLLPRMPGSMIRQIEARRCFVDNTSNPAKFTDDHSNPFAPEYCQGLVGDGSSPDFNGSTAADGPEVLARDSLDREPSFPNFTYQPANPEDLSNWVQNRRRMDVTLVNCGGAEFREGNIMAEVAAVAEVYLLAPPTVSCPDLSENCTNDQIVHADIFTEFLGPSEGTPETYAVLVR